MSFEQVIDRAAQGSRIRIHSDLVEQGEIFVALPGTKVDGARFIPDALKKGASWVITSHEQAARFKHEQVLGHPSPDQALGDLARAHYKTDRSDLKIIGITGTNGKTTTSYLLEHIFASNGYKTGVMGTISHRWAGMVLESGMTTPDCLTIHEVLSRMVQDGIQVVIMEVSSHALDQNRIAGIDFHAGVFTNLSQDHLDYHQDMEEYFRAKSRLFSAAGARDFKAIINADDEYGARLIKSLPSSMGFGLKAQPGTDLQGRLLQNDRTGLTLECSLGREEWSIRSPLSGRHNAFNLLAAQGAALALGLEPGQMSCLENSGQIPGRLEKIQNKLGLDVYVDYAHTPDALENVCSSLKALNPDRLLVLFGCGGNRDKSKRPAMARAVASHADVVFLTSDNPRDEEPLDIIEDVRPGLNGFRDVFVEPDRSLAITQAVEFMDPGDVLVVAGKGHETYQEVKGIKHSFSDVQKIVEALEKRESAAASGS
ncbi:UDP-N-acetylmuramoyl-L-alanyl-D-glutamate--2,6-diaminopimelate ligase [Desulfonatronovibrio hydrogenovorans]|uniref:UDP-N-acetylmuramoyl-L-alanyl-D-glutamate--2, 6-diaminopimelate ligase n=1 Tax=Desulfonatronovibrio hydrogenovorans TaxID=53245 RepID=UPI000551654F|nr:UDP-N-acetylmuramoyl-L-alanyl-D-glutamate--2,6-diaminopimelate ligase [Desulfonatronovibrio hydrogenovorans]